jgi:pyruvate/2-oxoglutarate dehydrogenase complex dihydrolipoamide acyltransferase (E2) component
LTLAGNAGRIALVLRNATDQKIEVVKGHDTGELYGQIKKPVQVASNNPRPAAKPKLAPPPPPPPAPVVVPDEIIMIRGREKTVEVLGARKQQ